MSGFEELVLIREQGLLPLWPFAQAKEMRDIKKCFSSYNFLAFSPINTKVYGRCVCVCL